MAHRESALYRSIWRVVMGSVTDALKSHPEYLTPAGKRSAHFSVTKRVTGSVVSFLDQREGRIAAARGGGDVHPAAQGAGDATSAPTTTTFTPQPHPRVPGAWTLRVEGPVPWFVDDPEAHREFASERQAQSHAARLGKALALEGGGHG